MTLIRSSENPIPSSLFEIEALDRQSGNHMIHPTIEPRLLKEVGLQLSQTAPIYTQFLDINKQIISLQNELNILRNPVLHNFNNSTLEVYRYIYSMLEILSKNRNSVVEFESPPIPEVIDFDESDTFISLLRNSLSYMIKNCNSVETIAVCSQIFINLHNKNSNNVTPFRVFPEINAA